MAVGATLLLATLASTASVATPRIALSGPAAETESIRARVEREVGRVVWTDTATRADLAFTLTSTGATWIVVVVEGGRALERRFVEASERPAARRVVALLIADAIARWRPPVEVDSGIVTRPRRAPWLRVGGAAELSTWWRPLAPQIGGAAFVHARVGPVWAGARLAVRRWCCDVETDGIDGSALTVAALAEASRALFELEGARIGVSAALGVAWTRLEATARYPGGRGAPQRVTQAAPAAQATLWGRGSAGPVEIELAVGAWVEPASLSVDVPTPYSGDGTPLRRAPVAPYLSLGFVVAR